MPVSACHHRAPPARISRRRARRQRSRTIVGSLCAALATTPMLADDTELFIADTRQFPQARPNVLLIVDTSGSLSEVIDAHTGYDPTVRYPGRCDHARVYWRIGMGAPPQCTTGRWFEHNALVCKTALDAFAQGLGRYVGRLAQYDPAAGAAWKRLDELEKTRWVECEDDGGYHGDGADRLALYARDGDHRRPWSSEQPDEIAWGQHPADRLYTIHDGNYLNWVHDSSSVAATRLQVLKDVATTLLARINDVNVGVMVTNFDQGGTLIHRLEDVATARASLIESIRGIRAAGWAPLAETLYEAGQYFAGRAVDYGGAQHLSGPTIDARATAGTETAYASPLRFGCQKNFVVVLSDGTPTLDTDADAKIAMLPGFSSLVGPGCDGTGDGACLDDMAAYLYAADLDPGLAGKQNVITHVVGFTDDLPLLASTAARGGGAYFTTGDSASLLAALTDVIFSITDTQTSFTAATVPVNSFNRVRNLGELYLAVFRATDTARWPGNIKKYRLRGADGTIVDAGGRPAIDPRSAWFAPDSRSFWSTAADGSDVTLGGAAGKIPEPAVRNVYTYLGEALLTRPDNAVQQSNTRIDEALLGIGDPGDPTRDELIDFIRGSHDTGDIGHTGQRPPPMGDPLHAKPVVVAYGKTAGGPGTQDRIVYAATNDGLLHAIDAQTGVERWAFLAPEFLEDQAILHANPALPSRHYGIDGNLRAYVHADADGVIEHGRGERVYLFFGMRRGGSSYYGLDVTRPDSPRVLWRTDASVLPGLGQSWSTPAPARIEIEGARQNDRLLVLVFGGGYDPTQDRPQASTDRKGNAIFIVDALNGELLWHASRSGSNFDTPDMAYSIPADIRVLDLDADGLADRLYAADLGGQVWRFDVFNGQPAARVIHGGVFARLGAVPNSAPSPAETRRFYYAPDVALASSGDRRFIHIGIGSGHRARPNSLVSHDHFYALRDHAVFRPLKPSEYAAMVPIRGADLADITGNLRRSLPPDGPGWRLQLNDGGWRGEKVLAESRTFNNQVFFTTYVPPAQVTTEDCRPRPGTNRLYVVDIFNGDPVRDFDGVGEDSGLTEADRYREIPGSIPAEVVFLFPPSDDPDCMGPQCAPAPLACAGLLCLPSGFENAPVRTYWRQENVQ